MFTKKISEQIKKQAIKEYPNECCGVIVKEEKGYKYLKCVNLAADKVNDFAIDPSVLVTHDVKAIIHSHCNVEYPEPSNLDIRSQIDCDVIFGIIAVRPNKSVSEIMYFGKGIPDVDLVGREFRNGPSGTDNKGDCYAIVVDYYRQKLGIQLKEFPRYNDWWKNGENLYLDGFKEAGFVEITEQIKSGENLLNGDVGLMAINSDVPNHAVVMMNNNVMIHHLANRLSRKEPLGRWSKFISHWLRYNVKN